MRPWIVCLALAPGCYLSHGRAEPAPPPPDPADVEATVLGPGLCPSISDDGRWVAYAHGDGVDASGAIVIALELLDLDARAGPVRIDADPAVRCPALSGDGSTIAYARGDELALVDRATGAHRRLAIPAVGDPAISDDASRVAFQICRGAPRSASCDPLVRVLEPATGRAIDVAGATVPYESPFVVALSGDGTTIALEGAIAGPPGTVDTFVGAVDAARVSRGGMDGSYQRWTMISDDGATVVTQRAGPREDGGRRGTLDLVVLHDGEVDDLAEGDPSPFGVRFPALSGDASTVAFASSLRLADGAADPFALGLFRLRGGRVETVSRSEPRSVPALSDDGRVLVAALGDDPALPAHLVVFRDRRHSP